MGSEMSADPATQGSPYTKIDRTVELPGRGTTFVRDVRGPAGAPVVMLLHGLGATGRLNWGRSYRALSEHFRVLSIDHRGHGRGIRTRRFRLVDCADDAAAAAEALGVKNFIAVGYSMGGPIASLTWRRHPDRVSGLVLCATSRHFTTRNRAIFARNLLPLVANVARFVPEQVHRQMLRRMLARIEHPELRERVFDELGSSDPASVIEAAGAVGRFSSHDWIGDVDVPAAVVVTAIDELVPASRQRKLAASIPGAEVFEIEADHAACVARADLFVPALVRACQSVSQRIRSGEGK